MDTEALRGVLDHPFRSPNAVLTDALESEDGVPEWLQLTPSRGKFEGRDGRRFNIKSPRTLVKAFNDAGEDIQLDLDHASEMPAMFGGTSAAVGWVTEMQTRHGGEIWAKVEWTPQGQDLVRNRTFRGLSPVFRVSRESAEAFLDDPQKNAMEVEQILSVALTNRPNLRLKSLNSRGQQINPTERKPNMDLEKLLLALGLNAEASEADVMSAIASLRQRPAINLDDYVPRADFDQLNTQVKEVLAAKEADAAKAFNVEVDRAITDALKAGKISPASESYHRETCSDAKGLERFRKYVETVAPVVKLNAEEANKDDNAPDPTVQANDAEAARRAGLTLDEYLAEKTRLQEAGEIE